MARVTEWMDLHWYPTYAKNWDDQPFREQILARINPHPLFLGRSGTTCR